MTSRAMASGRRGRASALVLSALVCVAAVLASGAAPAAAAEACPNEQLRQESKINPLTGVPLSAALPDCRAYEMVSPLYKQGFSAEPIGMVAANAFAVAPHGETIAFSSEGDFAEPENYKVAFRPTNVFLSLRGASGWSTRSAFPPRNVVDDIFENGFYGDASPDLRSDRASCGANADIPGEKQGENLVCALQKEANPLLGEWEPDTVWQSSPRYPDVTGGSYGTAEDYGGGSSDLSRVVIQPAHKLFGNDVEAPATGSGLYEIAGLGTPSPFIRLVNVDNKGDVLPDPAEAPPKLGDWRSVGPAVLGSDYHAVSSSGETIFFTAISEVDDEVEALYARTHCIRTVSNEGTCKEDGNNEFFETVSISDPTHADCVECAAVSEPRTELTNPAYVGASANGEKVFFTTEQKLLSKEEGGEPTQNLYEYDFNAPAGHKLVLLSGVLSPATEPAGVKALINSSSDGSHVYFLATGVLTSEETEYVVGVKEKAELGKDNLYGYDTATGQIKFIAQSGEQGLLEKVTSPDEPKGVENHAQTTPDGRYLVFSAAAQLAGATNTKENTNGQEENHASVYRYDFEKGRLTWISRGAPGFTLPAEGEGKAALIRPPVRTQIGAYASVDDWARAISGESETEAPGKTAAERHDGEYVIFTTAEKLQANDVNGKADVYEWRCPSPCEDPAFEGAVHRVSNGVDESTIGTNGQPAAVMSVTGSDIFFSAESTPEAPNGQLVGQDTDALDDVYDARIDGGFPAPPPTPAGPPESPPRSFPTATSSVLAAGGNLPPPTSGNLGVKVSKPATLTLKQKLAKALKACKGKPKKKRATCEKQARKKYGPKPKPKKKAKKSDRRGK